MYEEYFGFAEKPFSLTPDPRYLFRSECHRSALEVAQYAVRRREGMIVVTGDTGTGKTSLCRALVDQGGRDTFASLVLNPFLSPRELLCRILQDFGIVSRGELRTGRLAEVSEEALLDALRDFLLFIVPLRATAVLVIDEAQNLPPAVLEQIRMLSNLETDTQKLLQIVLVGHLSFGERLRHPKLRHLDQRVAVRHRLEPLTRDDLVGYVTHRISTASAGTVVAFTPRALDTVHRISGGVPRVVNQLCDRALIGAYAARTTRVLPDTVQRAASTLELRDPATRLSYRVRQRASLAVAAAAVVAVAGAAVAYQALVPASRAWKQVPELVSMSGWNPAGILPPDEPFSTPPSPSSPVAADRELMPEPVPSSAPAVEARVAEGAQPYSVLVGSFEDDAALADAAAALEADGYRVYEIELDLGDASRRQLLLVGGYADARVAAADERRLRQDPRFADARLIVSTFADVAR